MSTELDHLISPFSVFGLPIGYLIDEAALDADYYQLQKLYHPDCNRHWPDSIQMVYAKKSETITYCYTLLKDPLKRAHYLLTQMGINVTDNTVITSDFFEEIMTLQLDIMNGLDKVHYKKTLFEEFQSALESDDHRTLILLYYKIQTINR